MLQPAESTLQVQKPSAGATPAGHATGPGMAMEQATLGATVVVKGNVSGAQALYVDGRVEGSIRFPNHRVTVGRTAVVVANIEAREAVILGTVTGNIDCHERVDIRSDAVFTGDVLTQRISIDEGAMVKGSVEIRKMQREAEPARQDAKPEAAKAAAPAEPSKAAGAAAGEGNVTRAPGSSVLYETQKSGWR